MIIIIIIIIIIIYTNYGFASVRVFYSRSLERSHLCPIGTCRLATSRHLAPLAETLATMMSRGALLFGDGHLDGRTLWTGDKAEKLTSGVARKERNFLCGLGPRKRDITWKLSRRTMWIFCFSNHGSLTRLDLGNIVRERTRGLHLLGFA